MHCAVVDDDVVEHCRRHYQYFRRLMSRAELFAVVAVLLTLRLAVTTTTGPLYANAFPLNTGNLFPKHRHHCLGSYALRCVPACVLLN
jgi:hypothetical protein